MSLFNLGGSNTGGGSSTLPALNLQVPTQDPSGRKRSIFDAGTSHSAGNLFGGLGASSTPAQPSLAPTATTATPFAGFSLNPTTTSAPLFGGSLTANPTTTASLFGSTTTATAAPLFGGSLNVPAAGGGLFSNASQPAASGGLFSNTQQPAATGGLFSNTQQPAASGGLFSNNPQPATGGGLFSNTQQPAAAPSSFSILGQPQATGNPNLGASNFSLNQQSSFATSQSTNRDPAYLQSLLERQKEKGRLREPRRIERPPQLPSLNVDLSSLAKRAQNVGTRSAQSNRTVADSKAHYVLAGAGVTPGKAYMDFQALADDNNDHQQPDIDFGEEASRQYMRDLPIKGRETLAREAMDRVYREVDMFIQESLGIDFEAQQKMIMEHFGIIPRTEEPRETGFRSSPAPKGTFGRSGRKTRGLGESGSRSIFGRSALDRSMIGDPAVANTTSFSGEERDSQNHTLIRGQTTRDLRDKERLYIEKVEQLSQARLNGASYAVMRNFAQVEEQAGGESPRQLVDAFRALAEITDETSEAPVKERKFSSVYLNDDNSGPAAVKLKKQIIDGSRRHLEKTFFQELESLVEKNPREAQLGGRPTVTNKVRAYIRVRASRRDLAPEGTELQQIGDTGEYCWILIFYLFRAGFHKEALEYVENDTAFQSTDKRFIGYLKSYCTSPNRKLSRKLQEMINGEYSQRAKHAPANTVDPYRMACYKVIGRCDLSARGLDIVGQGVEDWIWLQFTLARESDRGDEVALDSYGLDQIRETMTEIGQKHFKKDQVESSGGFGTYFLMQILAGMFEQAIEYLHGFAPASAVHFAIALAYCGLLRVSDFNVAGNELLAYSTSQQPQINFVPLVAYYTASFRTTLPVPAVDYIASICLNSDLKPAALGATQTSACHECLRELCLETREFARLLGDIRSDGTRLVGAIEERASLLQLESHHDFVKAVTLQAAAVANERGQVADAVLLYHLSEDYDSVVGILNNALADAISLDLGESPLSPQPLKPRQDQQNSSSPNSSRTVSDTNGGPQSSLSLTQSSSNPVDLARNMITLYNSNAAYYNKITPSNRETCGALLQLLSARADLESTNPPPNFMSALETINNLNILPLMAKGSIPAIRSAASAFGSLPPILARCAGISVVWAVRAIGGERDNIVRNGSWDAGSGTVGERTAMKEQLDGMAKDLMVFAGLVKYKLPGRVYDMLTRAGGDVGSY